MFVCFSKHDANSVISELVALGSAPAQGSWDNGTKIHLRLQQNPFIAISRRLLKGAKGCLVRYTPQ